MEKNLMLKMTGRFRRSQRVAGFTLIELMIVVAVVAILAAIAFPSYQEYVRKSRRAQAKADLVELTQQAERWHTVNNTYATFVPPFTNSPRQGTAWYQLQLVNPSQSSYSLTATPQGSQEKDSCGLLSINQANVKDSDGPTADCW